jgi:hypothetical protein
LKANNSAFRINFSVCNIFEVIKSYKESIEKNRNLFLISYQTISTIALSNFERLIEEGIDEELKSYQKRLKPK